MKARCPKNPSHKEFITVAHVTEYWRVDESGSFKDTTGESGEVTAPPSPLNLWTCYECGAEAIVKE